MLTANRAANKSASCQENTDIDLSSVGSSEVVVIVLSLVLTVTFVTFIIVIACLMTRHQRQLAAVRCEEISILIHLFVVVIHLSLFLQNNHMQSHIQAVSFCY